MRFLGYISWLMQTGEGILWLEVTTMDDQTAVANVVKSLATVQTKCEGAATSIKVGNVGMAQRDVAAAHAELEVTRGLVDAIANGRHGALPTNVVLRRG